MNATQTNGIAAQSIVRAVTGVTFAQLHDDLLGLDERAGFCYALNSSGARIWELIQCPTTVASICAVLCREFNVDPDICLRETAHLLNALRAAGLITVSNAVVG